MHKLTLELVPNICKLLVNSLDFSFFRFTLSKNKHVLEHREEAIQNTRDELKRQMLITGKLS